MRHTMLVLSIAVLLPACSPAHDDAPRIEEPVETSTIANWTEEESLAWRTAADPGWLVLTARDLETDEPVVDCRYHDVKFAKEKSLVDAHPSMLVDSFGRRSPTRDGVYRWKLASGWHRLRIHATAHRKSWTPIFRILEGEETVLTLRMQKSNLLRVLVYDENGKPIEEGGVHLTGRKFRAGLHIENGVGEMLVDVDEVTATVGTIFLEDYEQQSVTIPLLGGVPNELKIRLKRRR